MKVPKAKKLPSGTWFINLRLGGKSICVNATTERECARQAALIKAEYINGKKQKEPSELTLTAAIDNYINSKSAVLSPSTIRGYRVAQKNYFQRVMQSPIDEIDWQREVNDMARDYAPKTVKNAWRFMCSVLRENGTEPQKIALPQMIVKERNFLSKDEVVTFVRALKGTDVEIPALLALHSLRRSEIAALEWNQVDLKKKTITVSGSVVPDEDNKLVYKKTNKNSASSRTVPIIMDELLAALTAVKDKTGRVCTMHPNSIYKAVNRICEQNNLPLPGVHGLRHTFVTLAYTAGLSELACMRIAGYSDFATMRKIYTHLDKSAEAEAVEKIKNIFANENANGKPQSTAITT